MNTLKKPTSISDILGHILADISKIIELDYFEKYIGQTNAFHLLIYLAGIILCTTGKTMTAIARNLKLCNHDALQRLLRDINLSRILPMFFIRWISNNRKTLGYLILDDTVLDKMYSKVIDCAGYCYDTRLKRSVMGINIVVVYWSDGRLKIPVDWRLWMPKDKTKNYKKKTDLAYEIIASNDEFARSCEYIAFDGWYFCKQILWISSQVGIDCISRSPNTRKVVFKEKELLISDIRDARCVVKFPGYGTVLVCRHENDGEVDYLVSTDVLLSSKEVKRRHDSRWKIEEAFRFSKQKLGLEDCQCRRKTAIQNHVNLVLLAHFVTEVFSMSMAVDVYEVSNNLVFKFLGLDEEFPTLKQRKQFLKHAA